MGETEAEDGTKSTDMKLSCSSHSVPLSRNYPRLWKLKGGFRTEKSQTFKKGLRKAYIASRTPHVTKHTAIAPAFRTSFQGRAPTSVTSSQQEKQRCPRQPHTEYSQKQSLFYRAARADSQLCSSRALNYEQFYACLYLTPWEQSCKAPRQQDEKPYSGSAL